MPVPPSRPISIRSMTDSTHSSHPRHHFFAMVRIATGAPVASRAEYRVHTKAGLTLILTAHLPLARTGAPADKGRSPFRSRNAGSSLGSRVRRRRSPICGAAQSAGTSTRLRLTSAMPRRDVRAVATTGACFAREPSAQSTTRTARSGHQAKTAASGVEQQRSGRLATADPDLPRCRTGILSANPRALLGAASTSTARRDQPARVAR
jgi:hypothetical protein